MTTLELFAWSVGASIAIGGLLSALITCLVLEARTIGPMRQQVAKYRFDAIQASEHLKQVKRELGQRRLVDFKSGAPRSTMPLPWVPPSEHKGPDLLVDNDQWSKRADLRVVGPKRNRAV